MTTKGEIKSQARAILLGESDFARGELKAAAFLAEALFSGITAKTGKPYLEHLQRVSAAAPDYLKPAGLLHDLPEDIPDWDCRDLKDIGVSDFTAYAVDTMTRRKGEPRLDRVVLIGIEDAVIPLKRIDMRDNSNYLYYPHLPDQKRLERLNEYFMADRYLDCIQSRLIAPGTDFVEWAVTQPPEAIDWNVIGKQSSTPLPQPQFRVQRQRTLVVG